MFGGADRCLVCSNRVYFNEKLSADGKIFHKSCFKCNHCKKVLSLGNYASLNGVYYCKPHFKTLFKLKGNYSEGFGLEKPTAAWSASKDASRDKEIAEQERRREEQRNSLAQQTNEKKYAQGYYFDRFYEFSHLLIFFFLEAPVDSDGPTRAPRSTTSRRAQSVYMKSAFGLF